MNPGLHIRNIASGICAAALACAATAVPAQTVFKHVDTAGHITYTDQPENPASAQTAANPEPEATKAPRRIANISSRRVSVLVDASEAARRLKQARLERTLGATPGPGELNPGAGVQTVNYRYWQRQEKLRLNVERALRRSNETLRPQIAMR